MVVVVKLSLHFNVAVVYSLGEVMSKSAEKAAVTTDGAEIRAACGENPS